jgi:hypothetical protein
MQKRFSGFLMAWSLAATGSLGAAEEPTGLPKGQELILEAASITGCSDYLYSVPAGRYPATQVEWLRKVYRLRFGDDFDYKVQFLEIVPNPLSRAELTALLDDRAFTAWAGPQLIGAIRALVDARTALRAAAAQLPEPSASADFPRVFFEHPAVDRYQKADRALGQQLQTKFKVTETDVAPDCN